MSRSPRQRSPRHAALRRLHRTAQRLTAQLHALVLATERLGDLPDTVSPPGDAQLTPRELEVWQRIADETDAKYLAIYPALGMSKRHFDKLVGSLFKKLGVRNCAGAARRWAELGMARRGA